MNWLALVPALLAFLARLLPGPRIVDDAYITFRYARNLTAGYGLVYNPGEPVLGTTTPLYTGLLAGLSAVLGTSDLPRLAWLLNALFDAVGVVLVFWIGQRLTGRREVGLGAALLWAIAPFSVTFAVGGLETSLVITLLLAAFAAYLAGRDRWAALALALGTLTRPDVLVAAVPLFGAMGLRWLLNLRKPTQRTRFPWGPALLFAGTLLPWLIFAALTFGSPLPHSMAAKTVAYRLPAEAGLVRLLQHLGTPFHEHLLFGGRWILIGLLLYGGLFAIGALRATRQHARAWPIFAYPILYAAVYAIANPLIFRWYLSPPVPFWMLGILTGAWALAAELGKRAKRLPAALTTVAILLAVASSLNAWTLHPPGPPDRLAPEMAWIELETLYQQAALDVRDEVQASGGKLAAGDIGALGWYTGAPVLDLVGLITPEAKEYYPLPDDAYVINYAVSADLVLDERPAFIVILEVYGRNTLLRDPRFQSAYTVWREYPTDIYGSAGMLVYRAISL